MASISDRVREFLGSWPVIREQLEENTVTAPEEESEGKRGRNE